MNEKEAESVTEKQSAAESTDAPASASVESTLTFGPATKPEDTSALGVPLALPVDEPVPAVPAPDKSLSFLQPGTQPGSLGRLSHYEVLEVLGRGAFGIVLKALDEKLDRPVAIKVLGPQLARNATARTRFVREARAGAAVNSKHVVGTYAVEEAPVPYLVMEYIAGETLQDRLDRDGAFGVRDVLRLGAEIAAGLAAAHAQGLIHRDIKPANILIEAGPQVHVKIADFGLARAVDDATMTQSGVIAGTPKFMSPEQARGEALDHRSDLFSLGSVLYTMCTGLPPFRAAKTLAVLKRVCDNDPQPIREINTDVPEELADVVNRLLVKEPAGRIQTAASVVELLEQQLARLDDPSLLLASEESLSAESTEVMNFSFTGPARSNAVPAPNTRTKRWKRAVAVGLLLLIAAFAVTEATGATRLFRSHSPTTGRSGSEGSAPAVAKQTPTPPVLPPDAPKQPPVPEPAKPKEPGADPVAAQNPFHNAKVGDWAEYKLFDSKLTRLVRQEVIAKTERTVRVRERYMASGQSVGAVELEIDLGKPYDPTGVPDLPKEANARVEKVGSGTETIRIGGKNHETSWVHTKVKATAVGREFDVKCWTSPTAPLSGVVKLEQTEVPTAGSDRTERTVTFELIATGHNLSPKEARAAAARGDWTAAAAGYARVFATRQLDDGELGFEHATVLLLAGDDAGYRKVCAEMLRRSGEWDVRPYHVARAFTLAPDPSKDTAAAGKKAEQELRRNGTEFWSLTEQGALAFRAGRDAAAAALFQRSLEADNRPGRAVLNWLWLSLVEQRLGNTAKAREWLAKATKWLDQHPTGDPSGPDEDVGFHLHNWLEAVILHREAERALKPEVAPPPREIK